ncbi:MAG: phosphoglucosamine mutase [Alphaproteobacteria bacterium]|nr:phosphoglucosamine mutase [Alphaproteobacteria bacterium]
MARHLFGTDGIRGTANQEPMTAEIAMRVGEASGYLFGRGTHRHRAVIGKDTRLSGYMIEPALTAGFIAAGMDVILIGPMPTPAVAMLTRSLRADLGVMISASHNPYHDNGIKLFGADGYKLSDEAERQIERHVEAPESAFRAAPAKLGKAQRLADAQGRYIEFAKSTFPRHLRLEGLKIVIDCANGAAYRVAPTVLWELGAEVVPIGVTPDGTNINERCGSTHPEALQAQVMAHGADLGIALDGDADRVVIVDEHGAVVNGDQILALVASYWKAANTLRGGGVAGTVMSNLGLERYLDGLGLALHRTAVGDRYVVEHMRRHGLNLGGEQSGHIILSDFATTGDGLIAALQCLAVFVVGQRPVSAMSQAFEPVPQTLRNVRLNGAARVALAHEGVRAAIARGEGRLAERGRLLVRPSGTEPVVRVMAEGDDETLIGEVVEDIVGALGRATA